MTASPQFRPRNPSPRDGWCSSNAATVCASLGALGGLRVTARPASEVSVVRTQTGGGETVVVVERVIEFAIGKSAVTRYVVEKRFDDGRVLLRPVYESDEIHMEHGSRPLTPEEFDELIAPHVLAAAGEG
jgi:hypothetical protein